MGVEGNGRETADPFRIRSCSWAMT